MAALDEEIRPRLTDAEAKGVVEAEWSHLRGVDAIEPLPSYDDQNFLLTLRGNRRAVLKIAASGAPCRGGAGEAVTAGYLDCEHAMMRALASAGAEAPEPVPSDDGREVVPFKWTDLTCFARVVTFLQGDALSDLRGHGDDGLFKMLGATLGAADVALATLAPRPDGADAESRILAWDLANAARVSRPYLDDVLDADVRMRVAAGLEGLEQLLASPEYASLPRQLVHGDANDENIFCRREASGAWAVALIDFGDFVRSARVFDLAIFLAYALFDGRGQNMATLLADAVPDPAAALEVQRRACVVAKGYHAVCPLTRAEVDALPTLIKARNCQTILNAAHGFKLDPDPYRLVSAEPAKRLLRQMEMLDRKKFRAELRRACGYS